MFVNITISIVFIVLLTTKLAFAQSIQPPVVPPVKPVVSKKVDTSIVANLQGTTDFAGLKFGVGISLTSDLGSRDRIDSAEIVNGIIRVTDENNSIARIMLESHYFFVPKKAFLTDKFINSGKWGIGPFVALQPGSKDIIEAIAFGVMVGFKRTAVAENQTSSWNFGLGFVVDPNVQVLGDGLSANRALPDGEEGIRYKEVSQNGILFVTSFSF